jgi:ABC-type dipeptide/oligopeptide/nickel transport system ATPase component
MQLLPSYADVSGSIVLGGVDLVALNRERLRQARGDELSMVFQDPMTSLNPVLTVGTHFRDVLRAHRRVTRQEAWERGVELLELVGLTDPPLRMRQYPHQLSGGMRQRVMIALALANEPRLLIADEPTTALDVTIQAGILRLLVDLRDRLGMSILLVTHDLGVVAETCDRVLVMYRGRLVEAGTVADVLRAPRHPYTAALLASSIPADLDRSTRLRVIDADDPTLLAEPVGSGLLGAVDV